MQYGAAAIPSGTFFEDPLDPGGVELVDRHETSPIEHRPVVEDAGQLLRLLQGVHRNEGEGDAALLAVPPDHLDALGDKGALHAVADRELRAFDRQFFRVRRELRHGPVEGEREQLVFVPGRVDRLKAELLCKRLVGEPGL